MAGVLASEAGSGKLPDVAILRRSRVVYNRRLSLRLVNTPDLPIASRLVVDSNKAQRKRKDLTCEQAHNPSIASAPVGYALTSRDGGSCDSCFANTCVSDASSAMVDCNRAADVHDGISPNTRVHFGAELLPDTVGSGLGSNVNKESELDGGDTYTTTLPHAVTLFGP